MDDNVSPRRIAPPIFSGVGIFPGHLQTRPCSSCRRLAGHGFGPPEEPGSALGLLSCLLIGRQAPSDPSISRLLTSTETGGRRSQIFCRDEKIYRQSEGDPVGLTGGEKAILSAWILRSAKGDFRGPSRRARKPTPMDSPRLFFRSRVPITLARGQEREFQCPGGG